MDPTNDLTGILLIRGVGDEAENVERSLVLPFASSYRIQAQWLKEANWSWADHIEWPYLPRCPDTPLNSTNPAKHDRAVRPSLDGVGNTILMLSFLRSIGYAILCAAHLPLSASGTWPQLLRPVVYLTLIPTSFIPAITLILMAPMPYRHFLAIITLITLLAPVLVSLLSFDVRLINTTLRAAVLRAAWPIVFTLLVVSSYSLPILIVIAVTMSGSFILPQLTPADWTYTSTAINGDLVFEPTPFHNLHKQLGILVGLSIGFVLAVIALHHAAIRLALPLKIVADIFRYLGDERYRLKTQQIVLDGIHSLELLGCKQFIVLSHSLGTVIALDVLRSTAATWQSIHLFTFGSPLRRWFWRFFTDSYPDSIDILQDISRRYQQHKCSFAWTNIYRSKDPVGGQLCLDDDMEIRLDDNHHTWKTAHFGYWMSCELHSLIIDKITDSSKAIDGE